jgi:hypothetical protein
VPFTVITQLAQYIYRRFHSLFDVRWAVHLYVVI